MVVNNSVFRYLVENSTNGIMIINKELYISYANVMAGKIVNQDHNTLIGKSISELVPIEPLEDILRTGEKQISQKIKYNGKKIIVDRFPIIEDGEIKGIISIFQDVSKYEDIVEELRNFKDLNTRLKAIINSSYDGIYVTDGEANTVLINRAYERITGLKSEAVMGRNMKDLVAEGYFSQSGSLLAIEARKLITIRQRLISGKEVLVTSTPVKDKEGNIIYVVTNVRDISDLVKLQNELSETKALNERYRSEIEIIKGKLEYIPELIVKDNKMINIIETIIRVSKVDTTVLILGETGVGKGEMAKLIHKNSTRREEKFIEVNCGAIPHNLMESELFGYEKGAFTGASKTGKLGLFELADKGTIFLDEVSELPLDMQVKLLKVLQDKTVFRIGGRQPNAIDVRIVAATNKDLEKLVETGNFRDDLYYRLNVIPVLIPPLRDRREDIIPLSLDFLNGFNKKYKMNKYLTPSCLNALMEYEWHGNIRELKNLIERLVVTASLDQIDDNMLPRYINKETSKPKQCPSTGYEGLSLKEAREKFEASLIDQAIKKYGSARQAAKVLKVNPSTIGRKINS